MCSYSCMRNMESIIATHNIKILAPAPTPATINKTCNCRVSSLCPLKGKCLTKCIVYKATVSAPTHPTMVYYGLTETTFKTRYNHHTHTFRTPGKCNSTGLSSHMWELKDLGFEPNIEWEIHKRAAPYKRGSKICDLCLTEKMVIASADPTTSLNKCSELVSSCHYRAKFRCGTLPQL